MNNNCLGAFRQLSKAAASIHTVQWFLLKYDEFFVIFAKVWKENVFYV